MVDAAVKLWKSPIFWGAVGVHVLYVLAAIFIDRGVLLTLMNALLFCVAIGVIAVFIREVLAIAVIGRVNKEDYLLLGIFAAWFSDASLRLWVSTLRYFGRPTDMVDHPVLGLFLMWGMIGGILHMTAPNALKGQIPKENWIRVGIVLTAGTALTAIALIIGRPPSSE